MATVPTVPNIVPLPRAQDSSIEFWWNPPTSDGGSALTGYTVSCSSPQLQYVYPPSAFNAWVRGLTNGDNYIFFITASNAIGESEPATWQPYQPGVVPSPPTGVVASRQGTSYNLQVSRDIPISTNTVRYWSAQVVPADSGYTTVVQSEYGDNVTTVIPGLNMNETQWQITARQLTDPGWSDPSAKTAYIGNNRVRSAFITNTSNVRAMQDSNGNSWGYGNILRSSFSTILFNSQSQFVQSIPPQSFNSGFVFYSSADGVTNTWLALVTGNFSLAAYDTTAGSIDPYGNFIGGGLLFNSTRHIFYDKNNTLILSNSVLGGNPLRAYLFKYAPSGVWNGIQDSNTWCTFVSSPTSISHFTVAPKCDTSGNIFFQVRVPGAGTSTSTTFFDKARSTIGSTIAIVGSSLNSVQICYVKYASDGFSNNSWVTYYYNSSISTTTGPYYANTFQINKSNELVVALATMGSNAYIYDKNQSIIGSVLPYVSSSSLPRDNWDTCLMKFGVDGTSNTSWRAVIQSRSDTFVKDESPLSVTIDSSNNILVTGYSENNTRFANIIPFDKNDASNQSVTQSTFSAFNMFVTRYTNDGTPEWITTLGGPSTIVGPSTIIGIPGQNRLATTNLMKTAIDSQNNLFIVGTYNSNALFLRNKFRDIVTSISSPRSNSDVFLAKFQADGSTGALARLGSISTVNSFVTSNWNCLIDTNDSICISGMYSSQYFGFYPSSNPSVPSVSTFIRNASINGNQSHYCARIGNGLSSIAIGRLQLSTVAGQTVSPFYLNIDSSNNLYTCTQINPRSTLQFYTLGNHTTIPNSEIIPQSLTNQTTTQSVATFVSKFTSNSATSWVIQQSSGQAPTITSANNSIIGNTIAPFTNLYGSLYIDSNQRVYTSFWSSTIRSTILYDKNLSSITIPQQITGNIIGISTIFVLASYASDGINRPQ